MKLFTPSSNSHWYYRDGVACHEVPMKSRPNEMRSTTVADARKLNLLPSPTNIINVIDRPELNAWRESQAVLAALTLPRNPMEGDDDFAERVVQDAKSQVRDAADRGQKIHAAIETYLCYGDVRPDESVRDLFMPFVDWADKNIEEVIVAEQTLVGPNYAGRVDLKARIKDVGLAIIDFKTRKPYKGKFSAYVSDGLQLSAYQMADSYQQGKNDPDTRRVSVFINSLEAQAPHVHVWPAEDDNPSFVAFLAAFEIWQYQKNYRPQTA